MPKQLVSYCLISVFLIITNDNVSRYDAGDHVAIYPCNKASLVAELCDVLKKDPETVFTLTNQDEFSSKRTPFPCPCTYRTALTHYVDITAPPRTHILKEFIQHTTDEKVRWQFYWSLWSN